VKIVSVVEKYVGSCRCALTRGVAGLVVILGTSSEYISTPEDREILRREGIGLNPKENF